MRLGNVVVDRPNLVHENAEGHVVFNQAKEIVAKTL